ncbi:MAG: spore germination protein, partial [Oscillospiraceae bacterium]|nr:spore germination protein [Oscillospiraceae bacterium]
AVIIVAFSGISSYTLPSQDLASAVRLGRFAMVLSAALAGIFGVTALFLLGIHHLCTIESCGIAYMHPFVDGDGAAWLRTLLRQPLWKERYRDRKIAGIDVRKQR